MFCHCEFVGLQHKCIHFLMQGYKTGKAGSSLLTKV